MIIGALVERAARANGGENIDASASWLFVVAQRDFAAAAAGLERKANYRPEGGRGNREAESK